MKKTVCVLLAAFAGLFLSPGFADPAAGKTVAQGGALKMKFLGKFDAGVPNAGIYKMYDPSDDVVCYVLMPDLPVTRKIPQGIMYEGNSIGSISCVKVKVHVVPMKAR
ncbi:hypothetical protein [Oxalobacter formigenes]|uniref:Uncharacterized protein n=1 Tax=Oxalobacter formigenes OXCC13 TaxID=556269 RepID=C3X821_OXAFO|nr:hypothetical protein [Oxalobacter formigenes]ARQ46620.1 hypothetical protein BRW83_1880 [Oxalobacter formigenes]ARQ78697.1 hypothetical protein BRW84_08820 [Oxalobacter formigenes OXCC13]EEO29347.1 hypothetical protein OFBG_00375 [Oxalobacter formigenes OXCC13]MCZ4061832.1 hypothetical protein [Oxalobacter formigenes]QDX32723.1 hypothetical protein FPZ51_03525 [Oxalobacter formigenes]